MNGIAIAKETIKITKEKQYTVDGEVVALLAVDYANVVVYSPKDRLELLEWDISEKFG